VAAAAALCLVVSCSGSTPSDAPSATVAAGTVTTGTTSRATSTTEVLPVDAPPGTVEEAVEDAYLHSWEVYADAMLRLDPSRLDEVYAGGALETREQEVANLAKLRTPALMRVEHDYEIVVLNAHDALVLETYINHSVLLDGTTMEPVEPDPRNTLKREYVLTRTPSGWRVSHINAGS